MGRLCSYIFLEVSIYILFQTFFDNSGRYPLSPHLQLRPQLLCVYENRVLYLHHFTWVPTHKHRHSHTHWAKVSVNGWNCRALGFKKSLFTFACICFNNTVRYLLSLQLHFRPWMLCAYENKTLHLHHFTCVINTHGSMQLIFNTLDFTLIIAFECCYLIGTQKFLLLI